MDTTPKYIKMCEMAWSIIGKPDYIPTMGRYIDGEPYEVDEFGHAWYRSEFEDRVPLYNQGQSQAMIDWESRGENGVYYQIDVLRGFVMEAAYKSDMPVNNRWPTWEQLWLAFVMHEKYGKTWDNEKEEWI